MSDAVIFETPGYLDLRAITTFGINAKPNSESPIGFFGTGLKYAIAVLVREKQDITLHIGRKSYRFYTKDQDFRDKTFGFIYMDQSNRGLFKKTERLPFTTELGKTWELWQAFRELYSNTLDEAGETYTGTIVVDNPGHEGLTRIIVRGAEFMQEYFDREKTFLPEGLRNREGTDRLQVFNRPSKHVYFRGMRVMDLEKPSRLTYNILAHVDLTEDRTAKYPFLVHGEIRDYVAKSEQPEIINAVVNAPAESLEGKLNFDYTSTTPSEAFARAVRTVSDMELSNDTLRKYVKQYAPTPEELASKPKGPMELLVEAIEAGAADNSNGDEILELIWTHKDMVIRRLKTDPDIAF